MIIAANSARQQQTNTRIAAKSQLNIVRIQLAHSNTQETCSNKSTVANKKLIQFEFPGKLENP